MVIGFMGFSSCGKLQSQARLASLPHRKTPRLPRRTRSITTGIRGGTGGVLVIDGGLGDRGDSGGPWLPQESRSTERDNGARSCYWGYLRKSALVSRQNTY